MPLDKTPWTAETVFPWGEHKGTKVGDAPIGYLMWLFEQRWITEWPGLHAYLQTRKDELVQHRKDDPHAPGPNDNTTYDDFLEDFRGF